MINPFALLNNYLLNLLDNNPEKNIKKLDKKIQKLKDKELKCRIIKASHELQKNGYDFGKYDL